MMGRTHALSGWCVGLALAPTVGLTRLSGVVLFAAATAGYALLPDLDHPGATASRILGPITSALSRLLRACSAGLYRLTKGPADERCSGKHRHMTHTVAFAVALGAGAGFASLAGGRWVVAAIVLFGLVLAGDALGDWVAFTAAAAVGWVVLAGSGLSALNAASGWVGVAIAAGCVVHCLGDAVTESGCPFAWPLPIAGETWYELRPPAVLRFKTGKAVEQAVVFPVFALLGVLLLPGMWEWATTAVAALGRSV